MSVLFRADASAIIGSGHVMRCLTLANELKVAGENCVFVSRNTPPALADRISQSGHELVVPQGPESRNESGVPHASWLATSWQEDAAYTSEIACRKGAVWIVVDHYAIDLDWEKKVAVSGRQIAVIDDLADRRHCCKLLLDQNLHENPPNLYMSLIPANCQLLLGPKYALLRPEFSKWKNEKRLFDNRVVTYLVAFSGADSARLTRLTLEVLAKVCKSSDQIRVVVNSNNIEFSTIQLLSASKSYEFCVDVNNMAELMSGADISIGAGGGMLWERAVLGVPSIAIAIAENQKLQVAQATAFGLVLGIDLVEVNAGTLQKMVERLRNDAELRRRMSAICRATVDGHGAYRVAMSLLRSS